MADSFILIGLDPTLSAQSGRRPFGHYPLFSTLDAKRQCLIYDFPSLIVSQSQDLYVKYSRRLFV